ncbi:MULTISPECIES: enoyl-CoA hydratase [Dietzia]|uniref:Enoyl-CoA hydratase domain-containing protein 3, mitochondrial n=1 Tax=Dietzia cinnamea TaxID=321318 RepID=A0A177LCI3_9ACTN|nr:MULTISPECIES: enoyl-CoA hydratase [Dietzia]EFV90805.1 putative enoyl-CoA hydratase [Dietzia cinnamea P4]MBS7548830.1 enoyl-CoA hydratase [Dietzia massiliensis]OAH62972.1 enoyl-CoA hydratase [Dietzia cinnamea]TCW18784.1 enoyl-CoA hydratase/carnithine racemase [Dietzia cinnamea]
MSTPFVLVENTGPIARVTLNRPERRNPLSLQMMREATAAIRALGDDPDCRVVVLTGSGPALSAGHEISEMVERTLEQEREVFSVCVDLMESIQAIRQPVIAEVQGHAVAAGCQLVATCDLAVAVDTARFGTPGVKIGLFCSTPMVAVSRNIGRKRAMQMLLTGETIDATTAVEWGLINESVPADRLRARVDELATRIADASPLTLEIGKQAFYRQIDLPQDEAYREMAETMATNAVTCDAQEGMSAFLEKRTPQWRGE